MMGLLALFNPAAWAQTLIAGGLCLAIGFGSGFIKGYSAANVAALQQEVVSLQQASEQKDLQIERDRKLAESQENQRAALEIEIEKVLHAPANPRSDACKLSAEQLRQLRAIAAKTG
jgi:hypothetical protein